MVAIKAHQAQSFAAKPDAGVSVIVAYGTDPGGVGELAAAAARAMANRSDPPGDILRIEDSDLDEDPDRLIVELQTIPMFGGAKVVRTSVGRRLNGPNLAGLFADAPPASTLVIEAGNLKPTDALRKAAEKATWAAALPSYADSARDLGSLVDDMMRAAGTRIETDARELLVSRLGSDRALSRGEITKLLLYCQGRRTVTVEDVDAIVGDTSASAADRVVLAAADGRVGDASIAYDLAIASGQSPQTVLLALQRHFLMLHRLRSGIDAGRRLDDAIKTLRPPLHFSIRDAVASQCRTWAVDALDHAVARIQSTIHQSRTSSNLESTHAERLLLEIGRLSNSRRNAR